MKRIAVVGSSPISLFEAIYQKKLGKEVTVLEKNDNVGGAWSSVRISEELEVELGCHIWDVDKLTYRFIERYLGEELSPLTPSPKIHYKDKSYPYDWKNNIFFLKALRKDFKSSLFKKKPFKPVLFARKYKYPRTGSKQLLDKLICHIEEIGVEVILDARIDEINVNHNGCQLNEMEFNEVIVSSFSYINNIITPTQRLKLDYKTTTYSNVHLVIKSKFKPSFSYVRVMGHKFIHRISDISNYCKSDHFIVAAGIFSNKVDDLTHDEIIEEIHLFLSKNNWLAKDAIILESHVNDYETNKISSANLKEIQALEKITVLKSINFIYGIGNNIDRWRNKIFT